MAGILSLKGEGYEQFSSREGRVMKRESVLKNKHILAVDDEPDVLEYIEEELPMCLVDKATDYQTALEYMQGYIYDIVILDIMGVDGFRLLELAVSKDFPTVMFTAHALTPEALENSIKLGATSFLPKDKISALRDFLEDVIVEDRKQVWRKLFHNLGGFFGQKFGPDWKTKNKFLKDFEEAVTRTEGPQTPADPSFT